MQINKSGNFLLKIIYTICIILFYTFQSSPQTLSISGKITDSLNNPIEYVNVLIIGTNYGDASDENGIYEIANLSPGVYDIRFSTIGYLSHTEEAIELKGVPLELNVVLRNEIFESDEVVVTSGKYDQKISELPVSAEIINGDEFLNRSFFNIEDALRYVPGINMVDDQISIRGSSGYSRGSGSRVLLALDGIPFYTGDTGETIWEAIPVTELKKVEIIKGAASSLYGSSAIGGVINAITRNISKDPTYSINGFVGFYDKPFHEEWDWSGELRQYNGLSVGHSNTVGNLGFNLSLSRLENSSYKRNDNSKKIIGFLKIRYKFTSSTSLEVISNTLNKRSESFIYWKDSRNALAPPENTIGEKIETNRYIVGLIFKSVIGQKTFYKINTSYYINDWEDNFTPMNASISKLLRGEFQINSSLSDGLIFVAGIEGYKSNVNSTIFGNPDAHSYGVFSLLDINFNFPLIVSVGMRYDYTKLDSLNGSNAISPKLGLNYKLTQKITLRSSVGRGFRAPTLSETFTNTSASGIRIKPNPDLKSETNLTIEAGVNYQILKWINFDLALFQNEYYDMIEPSVDLIDNKVKFDNVIRARIKGFEASGLVEIIPTTLTFGFGYTYLWARDLEENSPLKYRPRHTLYSDIVFTKWNIEAGVNFRYWSRVERIDNELVDLGIVRDGELRSEVFLLDLRLSYMLQSLGLPISFYINIKNVTNYNYIELIGNLRPIRSYTMGFNLAIQ